MAKALLEMNARSTTALRGDASEFARLTAICLGFDHPSHALEVDWPRLGVLAARHRVEGLLAQWAASGDGPAAPPVMTAHFQRQYRLHALRYLTQAAETVRLTRLLAEAGIQSIVLKGCSVAEHFYQP